MRPPRLVAANEGWQLGRSRDELAEWAAELGSDVPFFLAGGPAICRGRGERVEPVAGLGRAALCGGSAAGGLVDGGRVRRVPAGRASRKPSQPLVEALRRGDLEASGPAAAESVAAGRREVVALGEAIAAGVLPTGLSWDTE